MSSGSVGRTKIEIAVNLAVFPVTPFTASDDVPALKLRFARALLKYPDEAFRAGQEVFGADTGKALYAAQVWINDETVLNEKDEQHSEKGELAFLPSKADYARQVWRMANNERTANEDRVKLLSLYGDVMGFKERPNTSSVNVNVTQNRVMIVKDHGTDDDWEKRAELQQQRLADLNSDVVDVAAKNVH